MNLLISDILESVLNPEGRLRTLAGVAVLRGEDGDPEISVSGRMVTVPVEIEGRPCSLKLFGSPDREGREGRDGLRRLADRLEELNMNFLPSIRYLESELYIYGHDGRGAYHDVIVQQLPQRLTSFIDFIEERSEAGDAASLQTLYRNFRAMADELARAGIVHRCILPVNMSVTPDAGPILMENSYMKLAAPSQEVDFDNTSIAIVAMILYFVSCRPDMAHPMRLRYGSMASGIRTMARSIRSLAESDGNVPLRELSDIILSSKYARTERSELGRIMHQLGEQGFYPSPAFDTLIDKPRTKTGADPRQARLENRKLSDTLRAVVHEGRWRYVQGNGEPAFEGEYDYAEDFFEGRAVVSLGFIYGVIDRAGMAVLPIEFEEVRWYGRQGVIVATYDGKATLYNRTGERMCGDEWGWLGDLEEGVLAAELDGRYGYINPDGSTAIPFLFDNAFDFRNGEAIVELDGREMIIDHNGKTI